MQIITRFPPSPTGNLHIGGARTALFNYLFTKHTGGKIYLRLENTDEERSRPEYERNILDSLQWLGLSFDALPDGRHFWRQSERKEIYRAHLKKLVEGGKAYVSEESAITPHSNPRAGGEGSRRAEVIRFRNPNKKVAFTDLIRGKIEFDTAELGDMVIAKSLQEPLYHLAVVIDDHEMGITHVIRGEDHISNTARQILLQEALVLPRPTYAHIPLILAPDRSKLSKRHGAVSVTEYRDCGFFPEAVVNFLALLGWNPGGGRELFSLEELVKEFDLSKAQKGGAIFNEEKLRWFNREYLRKRGGAKQLLPHIPEPLTRGKDAVRLNALACMLFERISVFGDIKADWDKGEFNYLTAPPRYEREKLSWKNSTDGEIRKNLARVSELLGQLSEKDFTKETVKRAVFPFAETAGKGSVLWPLRVALSGREKSPDPFTLAAILGKKETEERLKTARAVLE